MKLYLHFFSMHLKSGGIRGFMLPGRGMQNILQSRRRKMRRCFCWFAGNNPSAALVWPAGKTRAVPAGKPRQNRRHLLSEPVKTSGKIGGTSRLNR